MEKVMVIRRNLIDSIGQSESELFSLPENFSDTVSGNLFFVPRNEAENDFTLKQIIPYMAVVRGDSVFVMKRTKKQTETRLHDKYSVGVGGHINPSDSFGENDKGDELIKHGMLRELHEEVFINGDYEILPFGCINDNSTQVGEVHFGICYLIKLRDGDVKVRETEKMTGEWMPLKEAKKLSDKMESWSAIMLKML